MTNTKWGILIVVLAGGMLWWFLGGSSPWMTPKSAMETHLESLQEQDWEEMYEGIHPDFKEKVVNTQRQTLNKLLEYSDQNTVSADEISTLEPFQVFRTFMQSITEAPRFKRQLLAYHRADITSVRTKQTRSVVTLTSKQPLRIKRFAFRNYEGRWLLWSTEEISMHDS